MHLRSIPEEQYTALKPKLRLPSIRTKIHAVMVLQTDGKPKGIAACFYYKVVVFVEL